MLLALVLAVAPIDGFVDGAPPSRPLSTPRAAVALGPTWFLDPTWTTKTNGVLEVSVEGARSFELPLAEGPLAGLACQLSSKTPLAYTRLRLPSAPWLVDGKTVTYAPLQTRPDKVVLTPFFSNVANKDPVFETLFAAMTMGASLVRLIPDQAHDVTVVLSGPPPWHGAGGGVEATCRPVTREQVDALANDLVAGLEHCTERRCVARGAALLGPWDPRVEVNARRISGEQEARLAERFADAGRQPTSLTVLDARRCGTRCVALTVRNDLPVPVDLLISGGVDRAGTIFFLGSERSLRPSGTTVVRIDVLGDGKIVWPLLLDVDEGTVTLPLPAQAQVRDWYVELGAPTRVGTRWQVSAAVEAFGPSGPTTLDVLWRTGAPQFTDGWNGLREGAPFARRAGLLEFPPIDGVGDAPPVAVRLRVLGKTFGVVVP